MTAIFAWIIKKFGLSQWAIDIIIVAGAAILCIGFGIQMEAWYRDSRDLAEMQQTQADNDALRTKAIEYEKTLTDLRKQNDNLQDEARKTPSDPVCGNKPLPNARLQYLKKAFHGSAEQLSKALS